MYIYICSNDEHVNFRFRDLNEGVLPVKEKDYSDLNKGYINRQEFAQSVNKLISMETEVQRRKKKSQKRKKNQQKGTFIAVFFAPKVLTLHRSMISIHVYLSVFPVI